MLEKRTATQQIYKGRVVSLKVDTVVMPSGRVTTREVVERPDTVGMLALDERHNVLLVRQFRYAIGHETLEIPAGTIDTGETPQQAAVRELREETGYDPGRLELLLEYGPAIGYCTERMTIFLAHDLRPSPLKGDEERIRLVRMPFDDAYQAILSGKGLFEDAKSTLAILLARTRGLA
jgi:ADP-ribose pyrophosphatase